MVEAANLLGIEAMTGHWEFTYGEKALRSNLEKYRSVAFVLARDNAVAALLNGPSDPGAPHRADRDAGPPRDHLRGVAGGHARPE